MRVSILFGSGVRYEWDTTVLSSRDGSGVALTEDMVDLSDPAGRGITVVRRRILFDDEASGPYGVRQPQVKVLVPPLSDESHQVDDIVWVKVDGELALVRVRTVTDDEGYPKRVPCLTGGELVDAGLPDDDTYPYDGPTETRPADGPSDGRATGAADVAGMAHGPDEGGGDGTVMAPDIQDLDDAEPDAPDAFDVDDFGDGV